MTLLTKNQAVSVGIQATRGVPVADGSLESIRAFDISSNAVHAIRSLERETASGSFGREAPLYGGALASVTLSWRVTPIKSGASDTTPEQDALYRMAGFTGVTTSDVRLYSPVSTDANLEFGTIRYAYGLGKVRRLRDCMCSSFSWALEAGNFIVCTATYIGYLVSETDETPTITVPAEKPITVRGASVNLGGATTSIPTKSLNIDFGLETPERGDMGNTEGYAAPLITGRNISGSLVLESTPNAVRDWLSHTKDSDFLAMSYSISSPFLFAMTAPSVAISNYTDGDDGGVITTELELMFGKTGAGNNELNFNIGK